MCFLCRLCGWSDWSESLAGRTRIFLVDWLVGWMVGCLSADPPSHTRLDRPLSAPWARSHSRSQSHPFLHLSTPHIPPLSFLLSLHGDAGSPQTSTAGSTSTTVILRPCHRRKRRRRRRRHRRGWKRPCRCRPWCPRRHRRRWERGWWSGWRRKRGTTGGSSDSDDRRPGWPRRRRPRDRLTRRGTRNGFGFHRRR